MTAEQEIKKMIDDKGISINALARASGVSSGTLSNYFNIGNQMSANRYLKLKKIINAIR